MNKDLRQFLAEARQMGPDFFASVSKPVDPLYEPCVIQQKLAAAKPHPCTAAVSGDLLTHGPSKCVLCASVTAKTPARMPQLNTEFILMALQSCHDLYYTVKSPISGTDPSAVFEGAHLWRCPLKLENFATSGGSR